MILGRFSEVAATRRYFCIKKFDREDWMVQLLGGAALGGLPVLCIFMYVNKLKKKGKYNHNFGCRVLKVVETVVI